MANKISKGEVYRCGCRSDNECSWVFIATGHKNTWWMRSPGSKNWTEDYDCEVVPKPHPDADRILAEFTAWRLTHEQV